MSGTLPDALDLRQCVETRAVLSGSIDLSACRRLAAPYLARGTADIALRFGRDSQHRPVLTGTVHARVAAACQRCLDEMTVTTSIDVDLFLVESEAIGRRLEEEGDYLVTGAEPLSTLELIEDELLLALPMVPSHADCKALAAAEASQEQDVETHRPFADLATLRVVPAKDEQE